MVFEGRNKAYGAYVIRKETGLRYRRVMYVFLSVLLVFLAIGRSEEHTSELQSQR